MAVPLMAAAAASAAASAASGGGSGGLGGGTVTIGSGGGKDRDLDCSFLAGALGAGDFLLLIEHDALEARVAVLADVFVDGHNRFLKYSSKIIAGARHFKKERLRRDRRRSIDRKVAATVSRRRRLRRLLPSWRPF